MLYHPLSNRQRRALVPLLTRLLETKCKLSHADAYRFSVSTCASNSCLSHIIATAGFRLPHQSVVWKHYP